MGQSGIMTDTIRVLLIEDNPADAASLKRNLQRIRSVAIDLKHTTTLADGLERLQAEYFDVVLLDLNLPDSKDQQTIWRVTMAMPDVPVVILTVSDDEALAMAAISQGVQDYFVKGTVDERLLAKAIRYAIHRKRIETELRDLTATLQQRVRERTLELEEAVVALGNEVTERRRSLEKLRETLGVSAPPTTPKDGTPKPG